MRRTNSLIVLFVLDLLSLRFTSFLYYSFASFLLFSFIFVGFGLHQGSQKHVDTGAYACASTDQEIKKEGKKRNDNALVKMAEGYKRVEN